MQGVIPKDPDYGRLQVFETKNHQFILIWRYLVWNGKRHTRRSRLVAKNNEFATICEIASRKFGNDIDQLFEQL